MAFAALTVRLALAVAKTNTVQDRASIAAAIIIPTMIYVARHAWRTGELIQEADWRIRNFIWNSCFAMPERAPGGWIRAEIVEMSPANGGIGAPNIKAELVVLAAMTVGGWALTTKPLQRATARIMQGLAGETNAHLTLSSMEYTAKVHKDLWNTEKPAVLELFERRPLSTSSDEASDDSREATLRQLLRHSNGLKTKWEQNGMRCEFFELERGQCSE
ncbi:hypothetical protein PI125_g22403 [Phytophthora idaei]|nr:hypothetical protein PI125_g22403 [Phytophthora idaei]